MSRDTMTMSEARAIAETAREAFFNGLEKAGFGIMVGELDGEGRLITEEHVKELRCKVDEAGLQALRSIYELVETNVLIL